MKDRITFLTKEQNLYFSEKLKLDVLIFGMVSMGNTVLPAVIVLFQWEEVIEKLSTLSIWGIAPLLLLFIEYLFAVVSFCQCIRIYKAIKEQKDLSLYGEFQIGKIQNRYKRRGKNRRTVQRGIREWKEPMHYYLNVDVETKLIRVKLTKEEYFFMEAGDVGDNVLLGRFVCGFLKAVYPLKVAQSNLK